jgi:DNA-binding NarL/FixJ family response regulator
LRILIVDDSEFVRHGIRSLLLECPELVVCGEALKGVEAIRKAGELRPDLILLDVVMPGMNGLDVATVLRQELPRTKILLMSAEDSEVLLPSAIRAGADGCVDKGRLSTDLLPAIRRITPQSS